MLNTPNKPSIFLLVQNKQHYLKLSSVAQVLAEQYDLTFVIDNSHFRNPEILAPHFKYKNIV